MQIIKLESECNSLNTSCKNKCYKQKYREKLTFYEKKHFVKSYVNVIKFLFHAYILHLVPRLQ